ncbi:putative transmembrane protein [Toxoplasma gondii p89]|uniref:Putative transmembrane protein n=1 Tax=Toxoplasma gondii p89 TaxID=943119 RepID=A0A086L3A3_TOXGO|nr:putative transmembrane protein [Toxoplasma gondii p89]
MVSLCLPSPLLGLQGPCPSRKKPTRSNGKLQSQPCARWKPVDLTTPQSRLLCHSLLTVPSSISPSQSSASSRLSVNPSCLAFSPAVCFLDANRRASWSPCFSLKCSFRNSRRPFLCMALCIVHLWLFSALSFREIVYVSDSAHQNKANPTCLSSWSLAAPVDARQPVNAALTKEAQIDLYEPRNTLGGLGKSGRGSGFSLKTGDAFKNVAPDDSGVALLSHESQQSSAAAHELNMHHNIQPHPSSTEFSNGRSAPVSFLQSRAFHLSRQPGHLSLHESLSRLSLFPSKGSSISFSSMSSPSLSALPSSSADSPLSSGLTPPLSLSTESVPAAEESPSSGASSSSSPCEFSPSRDFAFLEAGQATSGKSSLPRACAYAGCKAGFFTPRPANDPNTCYTLSECSQCRVHPESHADLCSQVEERNGLLLLMKSSLGLMPNPTMPFRYKPLSAKDIARLRDSKGKGSAGGGGDGAEGEYDDAGGEEYGEDGASGEGEGADDWEGSDEGFLQLHSRETRKKGESEPTGNARSSSQPLRRQGRLPSSVSGTEEIFHPSDFRLASFLEQAQEVRHGQRTAGETATGFAASLSPLPFSSASGASFDLSVSSAPSHSQSPFSFLGEKVSSWDNEYGDQGDDYGFGDQASMLGEYDDNEGSDEDYDEGGEQPRGATGAKSGKAVFLKFDETRIYRIVPNSLLGDVGRCATDSKNYMRLQITVALQPRRFRMSVAKAKKLMGLRARKPIPRSFHEGDEGEDGGYDDADGGYDDEQGFLELENERREERPVQGDGTGELGTESREQEGNWHELSGLTEGQDTSEDARERQRGEDRGENGRHTAVVSLSDTAAELGYEGKSEPDLQDGREQDLKFRFSSTRVADLEGEANQPLSFVQVEDDDYGDDEDDDGEGRGLGKKMKGFFGGVKRVFSRKKHGEDDDEEGGYDDDNPPDDDGEAPPSKKGKRRGSFMNKVRGLVSSKSPEEKRFKKETKKARRGIKRVSRVAVDIAFHSPAVKKCRKSLSWSATFPAAKILQTSFFILARQGEVGGQLSAFINSGFSVTLKCKMKGGCMMNEVPVSCALVSCVKAKHVSTEALEEGKKRAAALAEHNLKLAQTSLVMSPADRAARAAEYERKIQEKQQEIEAGNLTQQQMLTAQQQQFLLQQQLAAISSSQSPLDPMQAKLLAAVQGGEDASSSTSGVTMQEASSGVTDSHTQRLIQHMIAFDSRRGGRGSRMSGGAIAALVILGLLGILVGGIAVFKYRGGRRRRR